MIYFIGAGSNKGDRSAHLLQALTALKALGSVKAVAPLLENPPLLPENAPDDWYRPFLNTVFKLDFKGEASQLLTHLQNIESKSGRTTSARWAPRPLDLDILCTENDSKISHDTLTVPHAQVLKRSFTLNPLVHLQSTLSLANTPILESLRNSRLTAPYLMGVINCTPDSFSNRPAEINPIDQLRAHLQIHTPFVDIGAESTRPGATSVDADSEIQRLTPLLQYWRSVKNDHPWTTLSIDTRHPKTARVALDNGVQILNDVTHLENPELLEMASSFEHVIFMHSLTVPADPSQVMPDTTQIHRELFDWCLRKLDALKHIDFSRLIFDPGIGFNKTPVQSIRILQNLETFSKLPVRLLIGHSRKSFMNLWTESPYADRDFETVGASTALLSSPANILRVHNVEAHKRALLSQQCLTHPL